MAYCTNCGKETSAKKVCEHCGVKHNKKHNFCAWCGTVFEPNTKVCPNCKEPKRIGSVIGKMFRVLFAVIVIFIGLLYSLLSLLSLPDMIFPAIIILLVGIIILPFSQRILHRVTHSNLRLRKIIKWIAPPVLAVILFLSMDSCMTIDGYSTAMKHWDNTAYAAAMNYLVKNPEYKDSEEYIEKFENDVCSSLMQFPWWAGLDKYGDYADSIHYEFRADGIVLRRTTLWNMQDGMKVDSYDDFELEYSLIYDVNDDTGVYEVLLRIGPEHECKDFVVHLGVSESGVIVVNSFSDRIESIYDVNVQGFSRDTSLPE